MSVRSRTGHAARAVARCGLVQGTNGAALGMWWAFSISTRGCRDRMLVFARRESGELAHISRVRGACVPKPGRVKVNPEGVPALPAGWYWMKQQSMTSEVSIHATWLASAPSDLGRQSAELGRKLSPPIQVRPRIACIPDTQVFLRTSNLRESVLSEKHSSYRQRGQFRIRHL